MRDTSLVLRIAVIALGLTSVVLQARRFAAKRGGARTFRVVGVSLVIAGALVGSMTYYRLRHLPRRPQPATASALASPSNTVSP